MTLGSLHSESQGGWNTPASSASRAVGCLFQSSIALQEVRKAGFGYSLDSIALHLLPSASAVAFFRIMVSVKVASRSLDTFCTEYSARISFKSR